MANKQNDFLFLSGIHHVYGSGIINHVYGGGAIFLARSKCSAFMVELLISYMPSGGNLQQRSDV